MKNQYFGDIGDYGKYGLLRFLANHGISIAVNWYLTHRDESNDGNIRDYLEKETDRIYDPELYYVLREMKGQNEFDVSRFAERNRIPGAIYFDEIIQPDAGSTLSVAEKRNARDRWHQRALLACAGPELVFLDPDNGLKAGKPTARKDAMKYVYASEARDYYQRGQNVVYYCHKGRRTEEQWKKAKRTMLEDCPDAVLLGLAYHRGTQRSYIFVVHPERAESFRKLLHDFPETAWKGCFTEENMEWI